MDKVRNDDLSAKCKILQLLNKLSDFSRSGFGCGWRCVYRKERERHRRERLVEKKKKQNEGLISTVDWEQTRQ